MSAEFVRFQELEPSASGKTQRWSVVSGSNGVSLGFVSWFAHWRRYTFTPHGLTMYDASCLRQIADWCDNHTDEHNIKARK